MRILFSIFFIAILSVHVTAQTKRWVQLPVVQPVVMNYPLYLENIVNQKGIKHENLDSAKEFKIGKIVMDYYFNECAGDSNETYFSIKDVYSGTISLHDSLETIYLILLRHMPDELLNSKIIFYNNTSAEFLDTIIDFNLSALYNIGKEKYIPSNLKKLFKITAPEIQLVDYDKDKINEYKFTRLFHNGTSSAIETFILKVNNNKVEQLSFDRKLLE